VVQTVTAWYAGLLAFLMLNFGFRHREVPMTTLLHTPDPGMELHDLLSDRQFFERPSVSDRADRGFEALGIIARVFTEAPPVVLQKLVDVAVEFCGADSAGISLEESGKDGELRFRWVAISGSFSKYIHGTTPRFFSPCGTCLSTGRPQHYRVTKPYYDFLGVTAEPITDGLLIPWKSETRQGTIWAISHSSEETFTPDDFKLLNTLGDFVGISVRIAEREEALQKSRQDLESQVEQRTATLRQLSAHLMGVQDDERRKIARELHDSVGQYLVALKMNLARITSEPADEVARLVTDSEQLVEECLSETRTISHLLHPPLLDDSGLRYAAEWYVQGFSKRSGIGVSLHVDENLERLPQEVETTLFRVLQEALTNVLRHSGSDKVDIAIEARSGNVLLTIRDYGKGFGPSSADQIARGVGLTGLRERLASLGGWFEYGAANPGALVKVTLPLGSNRG
jgi:signal transduction histidine kinase